MAILIEKYRGYDISFSLETETFIWEMDDDCRSKKNFSAVKKDIDDFIKENYKFEPFEIIKLGSMFSLPKRLTVTGIRKDGRFIGKNAEGKNEQISEYEEDFFLIYSPSIDNILGQCAILDVQIDELNKQKKALTKSIEKISLKSVKHKYIHP